MAKRKAKKTSEKRLEKETEKNLDEAEKLEKKDIDAYHNKVLRNILVSCAIIVIIILAIMFFINQANSFTYKGVTFKMVKTQTNGPYLLFYQTAIPVVANGTNIDYNFYIRNDPRKLDSEIPFVGDLSLKPNLVINGLEGFNCNGDATIAIANMIDLFKVEGINPITDPNATCDTQGRYTFIQLQNASNTSIVQTGPSCYDININNCEILKGTERFMTEDFVKLHEYFNGTIPSVFS